MYEVNTATKTLLITADKDEALAFAEVAAMSHVYIEVMHVTTVSPWYAESVKIFTR